MIRNNKKSIKTNKTIANGEINKIINKTVIDTKEDDKTNKTLNKKTLLAYKYRIYPSEEQKEYFAKCFGCVRFVYNKLLQEHKENYNMYKKEERMIIDELKDGGITN
jgi:putative transposase